MMSTEYFMSFRLHFVIHDVFIPSHRRRRTEEKKCILVISLSFEKMINLVLTQQQKR
jgi:hypothetical protein